MAEKSKKKSRRVEAKKPVKKPAAKKVSHKPTQKLYPERSRGAVKAQITTRKVVKWTAPEFHFFEKGLYWSILIGLLGVAVSIFLILTGNLFPVVIVILVVIVAFQLGHEKPKDIEVALDEGGVLYRNIYTPYSEIKSFWVAKHGQRSILYFEPISHFKGVIAVYLGKTEPEGLRTYLLQYLPERFEINEMLSDRLIRIFRL